MDPEPFGAEPVTATPAAVATRDERRHAFIIVAIMLATIVAGLPAVHDLQNMTCMAALNDEVTRQASFIAYLNDFRIMMVATLFALPFLLLMRRSRRP